MDDYYNYKRHGVNYMRENKKLINPSGHATDLFSDWSAEFIRERKKSKDPFFCSYHTMLRIHDSASKRMDSKSNEKRKGDYATTG